MYNFFITYTLSLQTQNNIFIFHCTCVSSFNYHVMLFVCIHKVLTTKLCSENMYVYTGIMQ